MECHKVGLMPHWSEFSTVVSSVAALEKKNEELQIMIFFTVHTRASMPYLPNWGT